MKLKNEFIVTAPIEKTWVTLLDVKRIASCLPGAEIDATDDGDSFRGRMRVKLGAAVTEYEGVGRILELDEDTRTASFEVDGSEAGGQGTASATIVNRLHREGQSTRVEVETDLNITGRPAQFGRGIMSDVAGQLLEEFASRLEAEITSPQGGGPATAGGDDGVTAARPTARSRSHPDALELASVVWQPLIRRAIPLAAAGLLAGLVAAVAHRRRRRELALTLRLR